MRRASRARCTRALTTGASLRWSRSARGSAVAAMRRWGIPSFLGATVLFGVMLAAGAFAVTTLREPAQTLLAEAPRTLDEVGRAFNVTRERVRQIEHQSLRKLQALAEAQKLRGVA